MRRGAPLMQILFFLTDKCAGRKDFLKRANGYKYELFEL